MLSRIKARLDRRLNRLADAVLERNSKQRDLLRSEIEVLTAKLNRTESTARSGRAASPRLLLAVVQFLDLILEPREAETVVGDLLEQYPRRLTISLRHAERWLIAQTGWILVNRVVDLIRRVAAARAGR